MKPGRLKQASIGPTRLILAHVCFTAPYQLLIVRANKESQKQSNGYGEHHLARAWYSAAPQRKEDPNEHSSDLHPAQKSTCFDKNFLLSVLSASATKRDAKGYLSRFFPPKQSKCTSETHSNVREVPYARGVNLGSFYSPAKAIEQSPVFTQSRDVERNVHAPLNLHVAIVKLRNPQSLSDTIRDGVALTIAQLARLGLTSTVVIEADNQNLSGPEELQSWRDSILDQSHRLVRALQNEGKTRAQLLDQILGVSTQTGGVPSNVQLNGHVQVSYYRLLLSALKSGVIPIIPPVAYNQHQQAEKVAADDVVLALTRQFAGLTINTLQGRDESGPDDGEPKMNAMPAGNISLDRIIVLDPLGGIPDSDRQDQSHIFINLEQEYRELRGRLLQAAQDMPPPDRETWPEQKKHSAFSASNPISAFAEDETIASKALGNLESTSLESAYAVPSKVALQHLQNLEMLEKTLMLLPPSSSALIIRPQDVAAAALSHYEDAGVRTRQQRNALIHNLLTDKPIISSSLPSGRLGSSSTSAFSASTSRNATLPSPHATFVKRGMPITIIPDPRTHPWYPPGPNGTSLTLSDPRIDFPRLLHLIEDSFGRKLDVEYYLSRIQNHLAGIIIAGEYEGGAILTWESPPLSSSSASGLTGQSRPPIPYLDKFAVLKRSQGAGGVADIVFNGMVRDALPKGVVWRSRKDNPVNRWYFERADGTWKIPESGWTMFWTGGELWGKENGEPVGEHGAATISQSGEWRRQRWKEYVSVCRGIEASWADTKAPD